MSNPIPDSVHNTLNLDALKIGMPGITSRKGAAFGEAAITCLEEAGHVSGVDMNIDGDSVHSIKVT